MRRQHVGRRRSLRGADAARLHARRLLGHPSAGRRLAVLPRRCRWSAHGLEWVQPPAPLAHPLDDGRRSCSSGRSRPRRPGWADGADWRRLIAPFVARWSSCAGTCSRAASASADTRSLWRASACRPSVRRRRRARAFRGDAARALFAGIRRALVPAAGRAAAPPRSASMLGVAGHAVGWPVARGGSQRIADALVAYLRSLGGEVRPPRRSSGSTSCRPTARSLLDLTPRQVLGSPASGSRRATAGRWSGTATGRGELQARLGARRPDPLARPSACRRAGTVHLGGTLEEIAASEAATWRGDRCRPPLRALRAADPVRSDAARPRASTSPGPTATSPTASTGDITDAHRGAGRALRAGLPRSRSSRAHVAEPGRFRARTTRTYIGGDINGGPDGPAADLRPAGRAARRRTDPAPGRLHLLGVDAARRRRAGGMGGYLAATAALAEPPPLPQADRPDCGETSS